MIASALKTDPRRIIFTSGATESNNTAIKGYALANQAKGKHLVTTAIEHHSVLHTMEYLEKRFGFEVTYLKPENGHISAQQVADALRDDTILVSIMFANNETGDLLPVKEIGELLQDHKPHSILMPFKPLVKLMSFLKKSKLIFFQLLLINSMDQKVSVFSTQHHSILITCFMAVNKKRNAVLVRKI